MAKYSIDTGDRFGLQGNAQFTAIKKALDNGVELGIVWNKSHREHTIVGTGQQSVRDEADHYNILEKTVNIWFYCFGWRNLFLRFPYS